MFSLIFVTSAVLFATSFGYSDIVNERCQLPEDMGERCAPRGNLLSIKWSYNPEKGSCQRFFYLGCGGNQNKFSSYRRCQKMCAGACYDEDQDRWYQNGEGKPNICGSCTCTNGFWSCPAYAECSNALAVNHRCDAIFCPDPCPSELYLYDQDGCQTCQCAEL